MPALARENEAWNATANAERAVSESSQHPANTLKAQKHLSGDRQVSPGAPGCQQTRRWASSLLGGGTSVCPSQHPGPMPPDQVAGTHEKRCGTPKKHFARSMTDVPCGPREQTQGPQTV